MTLHRDQPTNLLSDGMPPEGPANPGVPRGYVCEQCPGMQASIARIEALLEGEVKRLNGYDKERRVLDAADVVLTTDAIRREGRINERLAIIETKMLVYAGVATFILSPVTAAITAVLFKMWMKP